MDTPSYRQVVLLLFALRAFLIPATTLADVKVAGVFSENMVLQRDHAVPVWGWSDENEPVTVEFAGQRKSTTPSHDGKWMVTLDPMPANKRPRDLIVSGKTTVILRNVLVGEVWLCSGQSNMGWPVSRAANSEEEAATADFPEIRLIKIPHTNEPYPIDDVDAQWETCTPDSVGHFSAVAYYFARRLFGDLRVPIGLISSNWGGSRIEPWTPPSGFSSVPELNEITEEVASWDLATEAGQQALRRHLISVEKWVGATQDALSRGRVPPPAPEHPVPATRQSPTKLYNGMIHPLIPYAIRGAIWYQGESNGREGESYYHKMKALIQGWRGLWNQESLPFYFVQLANFRESDPNDPAGGDGWARLREAQRQASEIPNTGMVVIIDIGEASDIHPRNKQDVGERLALWPLAKIFHRDVVYSGPLYSGYTVEGDRIRIMFDHLGSGLMVGRKEGLSPVQEVENGELAWFAISGADRKWHRAKATIDGNAVVVSSDNVLEPVAVRYAFAMNPEGCNLYNREGLPASPFRTDDW